MHRQVLPFLLSVLVFLAWGCGRSPDTGNEVHAWKLSEAPADAVDVAAAKATAGAGDLVTVRGRIGGRAQPISADSGVFVIIDPSLPACSDIPGDACPVPWDYCCEPAEAIMANAATIQLRDADGDSVALPANALSPLDRVVVVGRVGPRPDPATFVVLATGIYVEPAH